MGSSVGVRVKLSGHIDLFLQGLPHALRDHGGVIVNCESHGALKSMRPRDEQPEPAIEWVGGDPRFVRSN
jgi:hypothetical protein